MYTRNPRYYYRDTCRKKPTEGHIVGLINKLNIDKELNKDFRDYLQQGVTIRNKVSHGHIKDDEHGQIKLERIQNIKETIDQINFYQGGLIIEINKIEGKEASGIIYSNNGYKKAI